VAIDRQLGGARHVARVPVAE